MRSLIPRYTHARLLLPLLLILSLLTGCAYGNHLDKGDEYFEKRQYELALKEYDSALKLKPDSEDAKERLSKTKRRLIEIYAERAKTLANNGDFNAAIKLTADAYNQDPNSLAVERLINDISLKTQTHAEQLTQAQEHAKALSLLNLLYEQLPTERDGLELKLEALKLAWANTLSERAVIAEKAGHAGDALLLYAKAAALMLTPEASAKRDELRARLVDQNAYLFAVNLKSSTPAAQAVQSSLERSSWVQNMRLSKDTKNLHAQVMVVAGKPAFARDSSSTSRTVSYKSGTRQVPNPFYKGKQDDVVREQKELLRYQQDLNRAEQDVNRYSQSVAREGDTPGVSTGAEQSLSRAQSDLTRARDNVARQQQRVFRAQEIAANTPQLIEEDVYSNLTYAITTHSIRGALPLTVNITHADARSPIEQTLSLVTSASDTEHAAYPVANIPIDLKQLPSESTLTAELQAQAQLVAQKVLLQSLSSYRQQLLDQAKSTTDEGQRIHLYVIYILLDPTAVAPEVVSEIDAARGVPDSINVLARPQ